MAERGKRVVAVMQPYFAAYAGYYRLLAAADVFVIFDCVQFPRRGWVHRNRLKDARGEPDWLTLPLLPAPFEAQIRELQFPPDAETRMAERLRTFPSMLRPGEPAGRLLRAGPLRGSLVDYLEDQLRVACDLLGCAPRLVRSSTLAIPPELHAQERVLEILRRVGATDYLNAPGGHELYDASSFAARGVALHFLEPYAGETWSLLQRLADDADAVRAEIWGQTPDLQRELKRA
ncbi:MAG TPA: WbqC family protein [Caulobacteraceae bacterium]|jgi:hypothetical protein|nr:WbqC family protein [Caulobacteraceae bacterium]